MSLYEKLAKCHEEISELYNQVENLESHNARLMEKLEEDECREPHYSVQESARDKAAFAHQIGYILLQIERSKDFQNEINANERNKVAGIKAIRTRTGYEISEAMTAWEAWTGHTPYPQKIEF